MKPTKRLPIALAFAGVCVSAGASVSAGAAGTGAEADMAAGNDRTRAGFFVVPSRPVAYSFADICNLTIEPGPLPVQAAAGPFATAGLASFWARDERSMPAGTEGQGDAPSDDAGPPQLEDGEALQPVSIPAPVGWMGLCGVAIVALIAKRRRDWSLRRGLPFGRDVSARTRDAAARNSELVRPD